MLNGSSVKRGTSAVHFAVASANFWMGLVLPDIIVMNVNAQGTVVKGRRRQSSEDAEKAQKRLVIGADMRPAHHVQPRQSSLRSTSRARIIESSIVLLSLHSSLLYTSILYMS